MKKKMKKVLLTSLAALLVVSGANAAAPAAQQRAPQQGTTTAQQGAMHHGTHHKRHHRHHHSSTCPMERPGFYIAGYFRTISDSEFVAGGTTFTNDIDFLDNLNLDFTIGYAFESGFRIEADFLTIGLYRANQAVDNSLGTRLGLNAVKALYDFGGDRFMFTPYLGVGISDITYVTRTFSGEKDFFGFDVLGVAGLKFNLTDRLSLDLQYNRTFAYSNYSGSPGRNYNGTNVFKLGKVYKF